MTIAFFSNYLNHHQVYVADEFYKKIGSDYTFVASNKNSTEELKGGFDYSNRPYYICAEDDSLSYQKAMDIACSVDVALFDGHEVRDFAIARARKGLLSFEVGERCMKRGWLNLISPHLLRTIWCYYFLYRRKPFYRLCASAYAAHDLEKLGMYKEKCYKWGYFTSLPEDKLNLRNNEDEPAGVDNSFVRFLWCGRFIDWKHPELAIQLAERLMKEGLLFRLDMYGDGPLRRKIESKVRQLRLSDHVFFYGNRSNNEIHAAMRASDIFLFTSDKREGWGVVANEAMMNKCCIVGSDEIGAIPFLVKDRYNGIVFRSKSFTSLYESVTYLLAHKEEMPSMAERGREDLLTVWSPERAASNFMTLVGDLLSGEDSSIVVGPCSKAQYEKVFKVHFASVR